MKRVFQIVCVVVGLATWNHSVAGAAPITFSETNFDNSIWDTTVVYAGGAGGSVSGWRVYPGGHSGAYRRCRITMNSGGPAAVWGFHHYAAFAYDLQVEGAIESIDYYAYLIGFPGDNNTGPAIRQNGVVYAVPGLLATDPDWTGKSFVDLVDTDFHVIGGSAHPDFSGTGAPIEVGFITGHSTPSTQHGSYNVETGIDNWTFVITPVPEPATLSLLALGGLAMIRRRRNRMCK